MLRNRLSALLSLCAIMLSVYITVFKVAEAGGIETDGTLGRGVTLKGPNYPITADLGQQRGGNLFHSFSEFNLVKDEVATFSGPENVQNIISRVTGGNLSRIDGTLRSTITGANMYLLNPYGIMFGPNAKLDVSGSFHASTADYVRLEEGETFFSNPNNPPPLLRTAPATAFGFLSSSPGLIDSSVGRIIVDNSFLKVNGGNTLSLIATNNLEVHGELPVIDENTPQPIYSPKGSLLAPGGRINLVSVASVGEVILKPDALEVNSFEKLGTIKLSQTIPEDKELFFASPQYDKCWANHQCLGNLDVSGTTDGHEFKNAGKIFIRAGQFFSDGALVFANDRSESASGKENQQGDINIVSTNSSSISSFSVISTTNYGNAKGANLEIDTPVLKMNYGIVETSTIGGGDSGDLNVKAERVTLDNSFINAATVFDKDVTDSGLGQAGNINIDASMISLSNGSSISVQTGQETKGKGGNIRLTTHSLELNNAQVNSFSQGSGNAGDINITANSISISDSVPLSEQKTPTGIWTEAKQSSGGNINFTGLTDLRLFNSQISAESMGEKLGDNGGNVIMNPPRLLILGKGSALLASAKAGYGGNIRTIKGNSLLGPVIVMQNWDTERRGKLLLKNSVIDATSEKSVNGEVEIKGPLRDPTINPKSWREFLKDELSLSRCALFSSKKGKFFINARDTLPNSPEDLRR